MQQRRRLIHERTTRSIIGGFYEVYNTLGFGFREHIYSTALERELRARGHEVAREVWVTVYYKGELLGRQRIDMIVDDKVIVENKADYRLRYGVRSQLYNYLHATDLQVGLLLHYGPRPKFYRMVCTDIGRSSAPSDVSGQSASLLVDPHLTHDLPRSELSRPKQGIDDGHVPDGGLERDGDRSDSTDRP